MTFLTSHIIYPFIAAPDTEELPDTAARTDGEEFYSL